MKLLSLKLLIAVGLMCYLTACTQAQGDQSPQTLEIAQSFLQAAGSGDMETLNKLMADDFVWHNEGDSEIPWIGNWEGKQVVLEKFLPAFGAGLKPLAGRRIIPLPMAIRPYLWER